jgi:hypothetical protein
VTILVAATAASWLAAEARSEGREQGTAKSEIQPGRPDTLNIVPFGEITRWDTEGKDYGVIWEDPREIHRVEVIFASNPPSPDAIRLQYWQSSWPEHEIPRDAPSGAGQSGWFNVGDWFQGTWKTADVEQAADETRIVFTFHPVNRKEFPKLARMDARYRTTFKLRLLGNRDLPAIREFAAYTDSIWKPLEVNVTWGYGTGHPKVWDGRLEVFNGECESVAPLDSRSTVAIHPGNAWSSEIGDAADGIRARIRYAETRHCHSFDETVVTVRTAGTAFSFAPADLIRWGHVILPDFGAMVRLAEKDISYDAALKEYQDSRDKNIYTRVRNVPEQTLPNAWNDMPPKGRHYIPLSFEGGRQHFGLDAEGNAYCTQNWIKRLRGKDTGRCLWSSDTITYRFGLPSGNMVDRQIVDGCLPMTVSVWEHEGVRYTQTAFVTPLAGVPRPGERIRADDTLVFITRIEAALLDNTAAREARLDLNVLDGDRREALVVNGDRLCVAGKQPERLRMLALSDPASVKKEGGQATFRATLTPETPTRALDLAIPYITLTPPETTEEWRQLRVLRFDAAFAAVRAYWQDRIAEGAQIRTPEPMINDFYKAHVSHLLINTEREVGDSLRYMAKVGTFHYGVFANEACMMISDLDRRGYHQRAAEAIETWLHYQGGRALPGDYTSADGEFYCAGGYEDSSGYNQHHGWVLWCIGEHYRHTRDKAWLEHAAPHIVRACDWIINQRRRTIEEAAHSPIRAIERGLLPPGSLEDIADWRCWMSNNVYAWWGMQNAAAALRDAGRPEGKRLSDEAAAYKQDLRAAFQEAMWRSPVVRLRDGTWAPHIPSEVHRRGRSFGWITETLEGAIHLVRCGVLDPQDPLATSIIKDYEDNLYISEQFGYDMKGDEFERHWFSRGGISMQANLLCNPIPYLLRDEIPHFLRAYFNAFAASYFPDTRMMTEHALPNIGDFRGDHYKSSDEANSTYWLRLMFLMERDDDLWLGAAVPRYWLADGQEIGIKNAATYFGPMSMTMKSEVSAGRIIMTLDPPRRNPPKRILARFRHPNGACMTRCEVNGAPGTTFNAEKEYVELTSCSGPTEIVAYYAH